MIYPYPVISIWWQQGCMIFHMTCASHSLLKRIHLTIFEKIPVYTKYRFNNILRRWYLVTNGNVMWQTVLIAVFDVAFWGTYVLLSIQDNYLVHWWFWIILNVEIVIVKYIKTATYLAFILYISQRYYKNGNITVKYTHFHGYIPNYGTSNKLQVNWCRVWKAARLNTRKSMLLTFAL